MVFWGRWSPYPSGRLDRFYCAKIRHLESRLFLWGSAGDMAYDVTNSTKNGKRAVTIFLLKPTHMVPGKLRCPLLSSRTGLKRYACTGSTDNTHHPISLQLQGALHYPQKREQCQHSMQAGDKEACKQAQHPVVHTWKRRVSDLISSAAITSRHTQRGMAYQTRKLTRGESCRPRS